TGQEGGDGARPPAVRVPHGRLRYAQGADAGRLRDVAEATQSLADDFFAVGRERAAVGGSRRLAREERRALHRRRDVIAPQLEEGRRPLPGGGARGLALQRAARGGEDETPMLGMVTVVGARVVLLDVQTWVADAADGAPGESAEVDNQVRSHAAHVRVDLLRLEHEATHGSPLIVGESLEPGLHLVPELLVVGRRDDPLGFPALHIEEYASVVAALAPDLRLLPVHGELAERSHLARGAAGAHAAFPPH